MPRVAAAVLKDMMDRYHAAGIEHNLEAYLDEGADEADIPKEVIDALEAHLVHHDAEVQKRKGKGDAEEKKVDEVDYANLTEKDIQLVKKNVPPLIQKKQQQQQTQKGKQQKQSAGVTPPAGEPQKRRIAMLSLETLTPGPIEVEYAGEITTYQISMHNADYELVKVVTVTEAPLELPSRLSGNKVLELLEPDETYTFLEVARLAKNGIPLPMTRLEKLTKACCDYLAHRKIVPLDSVNSRVDSGDTTPLTTVLNLLSEDVYEEFLTQFPALVAFIRAGGVPREAEPVRAGTPDQNKPKRTRSRKPKGVMGAGVSKGSDDL